MPMRIFSGPSAPPSLSRSKAWTCLLVNALLCPGLGSLMARRFSGFPQLLLALAGAGWMVVPLVQYFGAWLQHLELQPDWRPYANTLLGGLLLFVAAWAWSILTGLWVLHLARRPPRRSCGE